MNNNENSNNVTNKLKELRRARGLTVNKLAEKMGENHQKIGRIERGKSNLTLDYLIKLSKALNTPLDKIFSGQTFAESPAKEKSISTSLLSEIIHLVEKNQKNLISDGNLEKKANLITKIFEITTKFPEENQKLFIQALFEVLECVRES